MNNLNHKEIRSVGEAQSDGKTLSGYAVLYNTSSRKLYEHGREFTEQIERGAFDASLTNSEVDIKLYYNHNTDMPLARTSNNSLRLENTEMGLHFEADLPDTTLGNDVRELLNKKTLTGEMSFGFFSTRDTWSADKKFRTVNEGRLMEISLVVDAAYPDTHSNLRSINEEINNKRINTFRRKIK